MHTCHCIVCLSNNDSRVSMSDKNRKKVGGDDDGEDESLLSLLVNVNSSSTSDSVDLFV